MATFRITGGALQGEVVDEGAHPEHPIVLPPGSDAHPEHPIVIPPEAIGPGVPTHPIVLPPYEPAHPIEIPPGAIDPGPPPVPAHPIVIPPTSDAGWKYSPVYGWVWDPGEGGKPQPLPPSPPPAAERR